MKQFTTHLNESVRGGIQHIEHPADKTFDGREAASHALRTLRGAVSGSAPITRKIDDKVSFQAIKDQHGRVGVKYKGNGSHYNFTEKDVDEQHPSKKYLSTPLKAVLRHIGKVLPNHPGEYQGGFLSVPTQRESSGGIISHQPNSIEYSMPEDSEEGKKLKKSKVSMTIHTELKGPERTPKPIISTEDFKEHPDVHVADHLVGTEDQHSVHPDSKRLVNHHLDQAEKIMGSHQFEHVAGHEGHLRMFINSTVGSETIPTVEGYRNFLEARHNKYINSVKTDAAKQRKAGQRDADLRHLDKYREHFERAIQLHGHVQGATNLLARGLNRVASGGVTHKFVDNETGEKTTTGPEGFVAGGLKIVDRGVSGFAAANRARTAILRASKTLGEKTL